MLSARSSAGLVGPKKATGASSHRPERCAATNRSMLCAAMPQPAASATRLLRV